MSDKFYKNILWISIAILLVFAPLARGAVSLWSITPVLLVSYFLIFLWVWRLNNYSKNASFLKRSPLDVLIFLFVVLAIISSIFSIYKYESLNTLLRVFAYTGLYYLVLNNFDTEMRNRLLGLVVGLGFVLSLYGLLQYVGILDSSWWFPKKFIAASFVNHNHFAGYLELAIPLTIGMLAGRKSTAFSSRFGLMLALCIMFVAFIFAQSRGGWVSLMVSLFVMNIILIKRGVLNKNSLLGLILISGLVFVFLWTHGREILPASGIDTDRMAQVSSDLSLNGRSDIWKASFKMVRQRPLWGTGIGAFDNGFYQYRPAGFDSRAVYAHNDYLQMAVEMGIFAPLCMLMLLFVLLKTGLKREADFMTIGCTIGILSLALHGTVDFNFHIPSNMLLLTIYAAFIMKE